MLRRLEVLESGKIDVMVARRAYIGECARSVAKGKSRRLGERRLIQVVFQARNRGPFHYWTYAGHVWPQDVVSGIRGILCGRREWKTGVVRGDPIDLPTS